MRPDAAKFINGNAQKSFQAAEMTAERCLEALLPKGFRKGEAGNPLESCHHGVGDLKGTIKVHLHREMKRISLSTWDSFAWIRIICRLR